VSNGNNGNDEDVPIDDNTITDGSPDTTPSLPGGNWQPGWPPTTPTSPGGGYTYDPGGTGGGGNAPPKQTQPPPLSPVQKFLQSLGFGGTGQPGGGGGLGPAALTGLFSFLGAKTSAGGATKGAQTQADAAIKAAQIAAETARQNLAYLQAQAHQSIATQNAINFANYQQWAARQGRINNFMTLAGYGGFNQPLPEFQKIQDILDTGAPPTAPTLPPGATPPMPPGSPTLGPAQPRARTFADLIAPGSSNNAA
jgi:hypothetical protein